MARQPRSRRNQPTVAQEHSSPQVVHATALALSENYGVPVEQATLCLDRLVDTFAPELRPRPSDLENALRRFPLRMFTDALQVLSASRAVELFQTANLPDLARRVRLTARLFGADTPLYSVAELAERLNEFIAFLLRHRDFIVQTGLPPEPFRQSSWLYVKLGRLYDTRATSSPWPPYQWVQTPGDRCSGGDIRACDYDRADFLNGLDQSHALRVEGERESLFDLKVQVLECVAAALRRRQPDNLWSACLSLLTDNLTREEVEVYLYMDRFCLGRDFTQDTGVEDEPSMVPGGLTNWLELAGHVEEELTLGSLAAARSHLDDGAVDRLNDLFGNLTSDQFYFAVLGRAEQKGLDAALDALTAHHAEVEAFWQGFRKRADEAFETAFGFVLPIRVASAHAGLVGPLLQKYADHVQAQLDQGKLFGQPLSGTSIFRRDGSTWTICFEGKIVGKPDLVGLFYLRLLLERPGKALHVSAMRRGYALWKTDPARPLRACIDQALDDAGDDGVGSPSDLGEAADAEAMRSYQARVAELEQMISQAEQAGDNHKLDKLRREWSELNSHLKQTRGLGGKRAKMSPQGKKDSDAVRKALDEAIEDLRQSHLALARHLDKHLTIQAMCRYDPDSTVAWEF